MQVEVGYLPGNENYLNITRKYQMHPSEIVKKIQKEKKLIVHPFIETCFPLLNTYERVSLDLTHQNCCLFLTVFELQINRRSYWLRLQNRLTGTFYALGDSGYLQVKGTYQVIDLITCNLRIPTR